MINKVFVSSVTDSVFVLQLHLLIWVHILSGFRSGLNRSVGVVGNDSRYLCGRSWVRFPGRSNQTQRGQRLAAAASFFSSVALAISRGDGPTTRYTLQRSTGIASIMKICFC